MSADWKRYLFDNEHAQRDDIETLRLNAELDEEIALDTRQKLSQLQSRLDRAELVIETLFLTLENQGLLSPSSFATLLREVDDLDGKIDGKAGVKLTEG